MMKTVKNNILLMGLCVAVLFVAGCEKINNGETPLPETPNPKEELTIVENPLTDLPWLKRQVDDFVKDSDAGFKHHVRVYQCAYAGGTGFLLELCVGCPDAGYLLKSYEGESLCVLWGIAGDPCAELAVDFENKKLLWEINNPLGNIENPLIDLPWLKAKVDEITSTVDNGNPPSVSIHQCIYGDNETGFLIDEGNLKPFYNWDGEVLCIMGGFVGETCPELHIVSKKLIWKSDKDNIYGTYSFSVCGVNDPLQNIEWLRECCKSFEGTLKASSFSIYHSISLYKVTGTNEHLFLIANSYSDFGSSPFLYSESWRNCAGEIVFSVESGAPPMPGVVEAFLEDKEFVDKLFYLVEY